MGNPRITPKDRNAIKGALRKAFARSTLHKSIIEASIIKHLDPARPRVKTWCRCAICKLPEAKSYMLVDHIEQVIPSHTSFEEQGVEATIDRMWCAPSNLQSVCPSCHDKKTSEEREEKKKHKKKMDSKPK